MKNCTSHPQQLQPALFEVAMLKDSESLLNTRYSILQSEIWIFLHHKQYDCTTACREKGLKKEFWRQLQDQGDQWGREAVLIQPEVLKGHFRRINIAKPLPVDKSVLSCCSWLCFVTEKQLKVWGKWLSWLNCGKVNIDKKYGMAGERSHSVFCPSHARLTGQIGFYFK